MSKQIIHIAIIEPSVIISEGLTNLLLKASRHFNIYQVDNPDELLDITPKDNLDIILMNPALVQGNIKGFQHIKKQMAGTKWMALVYIYLDKEVLGYFDDSVYITDTADMITDKLNRLIQAETADRAGNQKEQLSDRETDVLRCLVSGLSNKEIADKLNISIHTVISHRKNISQKTGIKSLSGLTIFAISKEIITLEN